MSIIQKIVFSQDNRLNLLYFIITALALYGCASTPKATLSGNEMDVTVKSNFQHIDWMTMDISDNYITYEIDVLNPEGKLLLKNATEASAKDLALSRAITANQCDAIFQPRVTFVHGPKNEILRVTVYGRTAKYKKHNPDKITTSVISVSQ